MVAVTNEAIFAMLQKLGADVGKIKAAMGLVVPDSELDSRFGNPTVKFRNMPKKWTGENFTGKSFSECPPELLDLLADLYEFFGKQNDEKQLKDDKGRPKSHWDFQNAKLARAWAERKRNGWVSAAPSTSTNDFAPVDAPNDDDIPF